MAFSTQTTIEQTTSVAKLRAYSDKNKDGIVDSGALTKAINDAEGIIKGYLYERYGTLLDSADSTTSALLTSLSDSIAIYLLATSNNAISIPIDIRYKAAIDFLEMVRDYRMTIPELADNKWESTTEEMEFLTDETVDTNPYYPMFDDYNDKVPIVIYT